MDYMYQSIAAGFNPDGVQYVLNIIQRSLTSRENA